MLAKIRMIAVLLASARIPTSGLNMAVGERGNPDLRPGGRDNEASDALERGRLGDWLVDVGKIGKCLTTTLAAEARDVV